MTTVKTRLSLAFASLTILLLVLTGIAVNSMNEASNQASRYAAGIGARMAMAEAYRAAFYRHTIARRARVKRKHRPTLRVFYDSSTNCSSDQVRLGPRKKTSRPTSTD